MNDPIQKLVEYFSKFPGVGPRQAKRFAYYLLTRDSPTLKGFLEAVTKAKKTVASCASCTRLFSSATGKVLLCSICSDESRNKSELMVVGHDVDVESVEKAGAYRGYYFVLGGTIPILDENPEEHVRIGKLAETISKRGEAGLREIILALDLNPEGEHTTDFLKRLLAPLAAKHALKISLLGRGLSTGTELQYSDHDTIKNALANRNSVSE